MGKNENPKVRKTNFRVWDDRDEGFEAAGASAARGSDTSAPAAESANEIAGGDAVDDSGTAAMLGAKAGVAARACATKKIQKMSPMPEYPSNAPAGGTPLWGSSRARTGKKASLLGKKKGSATVAATFDARPEMSVAPPADPRIVAAAASSAASRVEARDRTSPFAASASPLGKITADTTAAGGPEKFPPTDPRPPLATTMGFSPPAASRGTDRDCYEGGRLRGRARAPLVSSGGAVLMTSRPEPPMREETLRAEIGGMEPRPAVRSNDREEEALSAYVVPESNPAAARRDRGERAPRNSQEPVYEGVAILRGDGGAKRNSHAGKEKERRKRRRGVLLGAGVLVVVITVAVAVAVAANSSRSSSSGTAAGGGADVPPIAPDFERTTARFQAVRSALLSLTGKGDGPFSLSPAALDDPDSPQGMALRWLADEDERRVDPNEGPLSLVQRFVLSTVYFSTGGPESWMEKCNFLSSQHECSWNVPGVEGVHEVYSTVLPFIGTGCGADEATVTAIAVVNNNMTGVLPEELSLLTDIHSLSFTRNHLTGSVPSTLFRMPLLELLFLQHNLLSGAVPEVVLNAEGTTRLQGFFVEVNELSLTIPPSLSRLSNVTHLSLAFNQLTGTVPCTELGTLGKLRSLVADFNSLNGTLLFPPGSFPNLDNLSLESNRLSGSFPLSVLGLTTLTALDLYNNSLVGSLPADIGRLNRLEGLEVGSNAMTGTLPEELWGLDRLWRGLSLDRNIFNGTISPSVGNLKKLQHLTLSWNEFHGTLPDALGDLTNLEVLGLVGNDFSGPVPESLVNLRSLDILYLHNNSFTGDLPFICNITNLFSTADCHVCNITNLFSPAGCRRESPEVTCSCCTQCCRESEEDGFACFPNE